MKRVLHLVVLLFISINLFAQAPQKMTYQAVIRNASNNLVVSSPVKMKISILQGGATGSSVYSELHNPTTNANGLVSIEIGEGTNKTGTFSSINWGNGTYFLKTETDPTNGNNLSIVGTSQLLSVPYALHSGNGVRGVSTSGDTLFLDNGKKFLIPGIKDLNGGGSNKIASITSSWNKQLYNSYGGFARALISNNSLIISGGSWPTWPSGTTDQLITKIDTSGNLIWQKLRAPGGDHDSYNSLYEFKNGNLLFFGQQNAQGTQYFDGFWTRFDANGNELNYGFFSVGGSTSGQDFKRLPNGNFVFTGPHTGGSNYVALTDSLMNQLQYKTYFVKDWNNAQLAITNNFVFAIGSEINTEKFKIVKYDHNLNELNSFEIGSTGSSVSLIHDVEVIGDNLYLAGFHVKNGKKYGALYKLNQNCEILDFYMDANESSYTAVGSDGTSVFFAKSNLSGDASLSNKLIQFMGNNVLGVEFTLNNGSPFVPYDLVSDGVNIYCVGARGPYHWIGLPAVEKVKVKY